jgi:hypothetical protein
MRYWTGRARIAAGLGVVVVAGAMLAGEAAAAPAARNGHEPPLVTGTPCSATARACVDLDTQRAWLIQDGRTVRGPVPISSGGAGAETPVGRSFRVYLKDRDHRSQEFRMANGQPAPMPWSVFFADGGIAFHSGNPARASAGCIHLRPADAQAWFENLQVGDQVQVVRGNQERAARAHR